MFEDVEVKSLHCKLCNVEFCDEAGRTVYGSPGQLVMRAIRYGAWKVSRAENIEDGSAPIDSPEYDIMVSLVCKGCGGARCLTTTFSGTMRA